MRPAEHYHRRHRRCRSAGLHAAATVVFGSTAAAFQHRIGGHALPSHRLQRFPLPRIGGKSYSFISLYSIPPTAEELIAAAQQSLSQNDTDAAFAQLAEAHATNANAPGLLVAFEDVFRIRINLYNDPIDRLGLGSLLLEREKYSEASVEFQAVLDDATLTDCTSRERAASSLFRCRANVCDWSGYDENCAALVATVRTSLDANQIPTVHPYEALMWSCLSISDAARVGAQYGRRALASVNTSTALPLPDLSPRGRRWRETGKIRIGYLSNDFTGRHPLGFLMQDVFRFHSNDFEVYIYSLMEYDDSQEIAKIRASASGAWREILGSPYESARTIRADDLDVLVDLTIYNGPASEAEILAHRLCHNQLSFMGFPASCGCKLLIDYLVCDKITIPSHLRQYYSERLLYMPNCFFVNSHRFLPTNGMNDSYFREVSREEVGLPECGFIFCAHHRPDKIDPRTFRAWLRALTRVPASYLWILTAGEEMECNLRTIASEEFGLEENRLIFCKKVPRNDHLLRLRLADLFLDTPAYNAHTTGCDSLVNALPMVSLLRLVPANEGDVDTEKMPSRVGASFLHTLDLNELIATDMTEYENIMVRCATDTQWYNNVKQRLRTSRLSSSLFDTDRWMKTWEDGLKDVVANDDITDTLHVVEQ